MSRPYRSLGLTAFLMAGLLCASPALAHKASVFAWVEGNTIQTQSKFSGGRYVNNGLIEVYDPAGNKLLEGRTDERGRFGFPIPQRSDLKIVLSAGSGHGNHWTVRATEIGSAQPSEKSPPPAAIPSASIPEEGPAAGPCLDRETLENMIRASLEQELAPLRAQIAEQAWGLRDILSGIGYILGLMGLAGYLHYRRLTKTVERSSS
jgi:nickel transport protein